MATRAHHPRELLDGNRSGTNAALCARLLKDVPSIRRTHGLDRQSTAEESEADPARLHSVDTRLTGDLKAIAATSGWPTIRLVGMEASDVAMTILSHSEHSRWQPSILAGLEELATADRVDGSRPALAVGKPLVSQGQPQRYGAGSSSSTDTWQCTQWSSPTPTDTHRQPPRSRPAPTA